MRILGLDFGSKTVGVAVTDPLGITAQGVGIIRREKETHLRPTFRRIGELIDHYGVESIVLGLPLNMDDTMGDRAEKTLAFKDFKKYVDMIAAVIILRDYMNNDQEASRSVPTDSV